MVILHQNRFVSILHDHSYYCRNDLLPVSSSLEYRHTLTPDKDEGKNEARNAFNPKIMINSIQSSLLGPYTIDRTLSCHTLCSGATPMKMKERMKREMHSNPKIMINSVRSSQNQNDSIWERLSSVRDTAMLFDTLTKKSIMTDVQLSMAMWCFRPF
jgi:hypothetical protein